MDRPTLLLNDLRTKLEAKHGYRLQRALSATVTFERLEQGEFIINIQPLRPSDAPPFRKTFTRQLVFAGTMAFSPNAWAIEKKACDYADDILREALQARGMI